MNLCWLSGHLSNLDGREPQATVLRERFTRAELTEEEVDRLVQEFLSLVKTRGGEFWQGGWPGEVHYKYHSM